MHLAFANVHMLKALPSFLCSSPAEMEKLAEEMYRQMPCFSAHAMQQWVHIIRLLRNESPPRRRGGRRRNRRTLDLSNALSWLSDSDCIALEVHAFLKDCPHEVLWVSS